MRHRKGFNQLSRKSEHRKAMFANMASSLILHKRIKTTTAKAKALRMYVEPLITKSKNDSTHSRRVVFSYLKDKEAVSELFREVSPKIAERPGGYTRILKTGNRLGDNADMCIIELVDYNENMLSAAGEAKSKATRRRRGGKKKSLETAIETAPAETTPEESEKDSEQPGSEKEEPKAEVSESVIEEEAIEVVAGEEIIEEVEEPAQPETEINETEGSEPENPEAADQATDEKPAKEDALNSDEEPEAKVQDEEEKPEKETD
jgi:large subunit ribosomal protein L17